MHGLQRFLSIVGLLWYGIASAETDRNAAKLTLNIQAQPLIKALNSWAVQTGTQIVIPESEHTQRISRQVTGELTAQEALDQLLAGTGLSFEWLNERVIVIRTANSKAETPPRKQTATPSEPLEITKRQEAEVIVTGSRLRGDIRADGSADTAAPVIIFDRKRLDETGIASVSELLKFVPQQPYGPRIEVGMPNAAQHVEIRGLGFDTTLVLINGRRAVPSAVSLASNAFDVNTLPLTAIERVEMLSDSAAGVYGADAIGGVVNIILKENISRPIVDFHFGAADGGAEERRVSLGDGYSNDRLRASFVLDYFDRSILLGAERDRWRDQDFRRFGGQDQRVLTGTISSLTSANLPGLSSRFATIPAGTAGMVLTPADFLQTAGQRNSESLYKYQSAIPKGRRRSVTALADLDLTSAINAFGEFLYVDSQSTTQFAPHAQTLRVPATNPFNPFHTAVAVDYLFRELGPRRSHVQSEIYRAVAGLRGTVAKWDWELSVMKIGDEGSSRSENWVDATRLNAALAATDPGQALNVFQDGAAGSPALLASLIDESSPNSYGLAYMQSTAVLRRELLKLPAGPIEMVIGTEWLYSEISYNDFFRVARDRIVTAGFGEMRLPIVGQAMRIPAFQELVLTLAMRHDHYDDVGYSFNPQYGIIWTPTSNLIVRASYGTSFRAPSLFELYAPRTTIRDVLIPDPLRNNEFTSVTFVSGGNPKLEPIEAISQTAGFVFTPGAIQNLQLSINYWRLEMDKRVSVLPFQIVAINQDRFPDRVVRAERTVADIEAGLPGRLQFLDISRINYGLVETSGIDIGADYAIQTRLGDFGWTLSGTWVDKYRATELPGTPAINRVGIANLRGTIARSKAVATTRWAVNGIGLSATVRYSSGYADVNVFGNTTGNVVPSQTLVDVQASFDIEQLLDQRLSSLPDLKFTAGVSNLFDAEPRFAEVGLTIGFDQNQGDLRQRYGYLRLSAGF